MSQELNTAKTLPLIGSTEFVDILHTYKHIPAKIDTGADSSSIWASDISVDESGDLHFKLFDSSSPFYDGKDIVYKLGDYSATYLRNSTGNGNIRYCLKIPVRLGGKTIRGTFTLANRSRNSRGILIGRRTISGKFLIDVRINATKRRVYGRLSDKLNDELKRNPAKFHEKYIKPKSN